MVGIIGAMEKEVSLLFDALEEPVTVKSGMFEFHTGFYNGEKIALLQCGIGKVNAAVGCSAMLQVFQPKLVINTGSAGGIAPGLKFGDVVISTGLLYHDVDVTAFNYALGQVPGHPKVFPVGEDLVAMAEKAVGELKEEEALPADMNHCRGIIGSGDMFMHRMEDIDRIRGAFPEVVAVEMEGAAIAHCCHLFSVPSLTIRALSDIAGKESPIAFKEFLPIASAHSAEIVRRIIRNR